MIADLAKQPFKEWCFAVLNSQMQKQSSLFLTDMALEPPNTSIGDTFSADTRADNCLTLSTIHSAKGLEWHTVFIIWALDGRFPSAHALYKEEELEEDEWRYYAYTFYFTIYDISL